MTDTAFDPLTRLRAENARLRALVDVYKQREKLYVRAIEELVDTPATSVRRVRYSRTEVEVYFDTGAVWRRVTKCEETPSSVRFFEDWVPVKAVPTTRPAIVQDLNDALERRPLHVLGRIAS